MDGVRVNLKLFEETINEEKKKNNRDFSLKWKKKDMVDFVGTKKRGI